MRMSTITAIAASAVLAAAGLPQTAHAQQGRSTVVQHARNNPGGALLLDANLKPFYHGVASGDPLSDAVIIWTRVTPEEEGTITVNWYMSSDPLGTTIVKEGSTSTDGSRDYTVKVDVTGLNPGTTYYYWFSALGQNSLTGRTRTASANAQHLRFAVVSCNSYPHGYFNAFGRIADRNDLDAVIHLGDYIYEYDISEGYGAEVGQKINRISEPANEIVKLADYRTRYGQYRLDADLRRVHQQQAFIAIWDDHEFANDAYSDGAGNHSPETEGDWNERVSAAKKAYFEWLPIREDGSQNIYRKFSYGALADLIMLDTRLVGRQKQLESSTDPVLNDDSRTLLGQEQLQWFNNALTTSAARWKIIGNQVVFAPVLTGFLGAQAADLFLDVWNGYPAERRRVLDAIKNNSLNNVVILTGDFHTALTTDVPDSVALYNQATGEGSLAVEFATPSITSANFDESLYGTTRQSILDDSSIPDDIKNNPTRLDSAIQVQLTQQIAIIGAVLGSANPHLKRTDFVRHGYIIADATQERMQGDYFFVNDILQPTQGETFGYSYYTNNGTSTLVAADGPAPGKTVQETPAPDTPRPVSTTDQPEQPQLVLLNLYPNPAKETGYCTFSVPRNGIPASLALCDMQGKVVSTIAAEINGQGVYTAIFEWKNIPDGVYFIRLSQGEQSVTRKVVVQK